MKKNGKRITAWLMACIMVWSLVLVPAGKVEAAETIENATDSSKSIYVELKKESTIPVGKWGDNSPSVELTQYAVVVHNNSDQMISDWQVAIVCQDASNWNDGWNGASRNGNTVTVGTYKGTDEDGKTWTNAEIAAGETGTGAGFQIAASAIDNAAITLTYTVGESSGEVGEDATATDPAAIGSKSDKVTATITQSNISGEYHEYYLKVNNGLSESISDWIVVVPMTGINSSEAWGSWAKVKTSYTSAYLYLTPSSSSDGVIAAGGSFGSTTEGEHKFNYKGSMDINVSNAIVYYKTGSSSSGAFDAVVKNATQAGGSSGGSGSSGGTSGSLTDTTTDKNLDIDYNYAKLLQESLYFYDANMCGPEVSSKCGLSWRSNCHTADQTVTYKGKTVDVSGGFHDAGDHVKFGLPQGYSAMVLALGYYEFGQAFDELGQTAHYQTIMDYFCDYFTRCTVYNGSSVEAFCYQVGDGGADHAYWGAPENQTGSRPAFFADASNPATDEVCVAIAALAIHAANFPESANSETYLKTAKDLMTFVQKNSKSCATNGAAGFYNSTDWKDDYCSALAALYAATGEASYKTELNANYNSESIKTGWVLTWDNSGAAAALLSEDWGKVHTFASYGNTNTAQGFKLIDSWGSARYNATCQFLGLAYDKGNDKFSVADGSFGSWATGQMKYLLGNNNAKRCFVVGYNENSSKYPHHRAASRSSDAGQTREDHYTLLGALVGGPSDANDTYQDNQADYNCNEVALDYNAGFVGAAAGLYLLHKDDADASNSLATEEELSQIGVSKYYGSTTPSTPTAVAGITVSPTEATLEIGDTETLKATVTPTNATNKKVTWSSSDDKVANVDVKGVVKAVAAGTATITVTTVDGEKTATCEVTVKKPAAVQSEIVGAKKVSVASGTKLGDITAKYKAVAKDTDITDKGTFSWKKNGEAIAEDTILKVTDAGEYTLVFTPADTDAYIGTELTVTVQVNRKANAEKPEAPSVAGKTDTSVTLGTYAGKEEVQYGIEKAGEYEWQDSPEFTELSPYSDYTFALRYAATAEVEAGGAGEAITVKTYFSEKDTYIVDVSKLSDKNYVEGHNGTITYDETEKKLTLNDSDKTYTLTGTAEDVSLDSSAAEIILVGATIKSVTSKSGISLKVEEKNVVKEGVASDGKITIDQGAVEGELTVDAGKDGAITGDVIVINGGTIIANGTDEVPALKATKEIDLIGGDLTANVGEAAKGIIPIQVDPNNEEAKIWLEGCQVTSKANPIYSQDPVDKNGKPVSLCTITYQADGEVVSTKEAKKGSKITLPALPEKAGYHAEGWKRIGGTSVGKVGDEQDVDDDISFEAIYTEITGDLTVTVGTSKDLEANYKKDGDGVAVTIKNNTNIVLDAVSLTIDSDDFMLGHTKLEQLQPEEERVVKVQLKSGKKTGTYTTKLKVSVISGEFETIEKTISRIVKEAEKPNILITGIEVELDKDSVVLAAEDGATATVNAKATITPSNATNQEVTWSTSKPEIATVNAQGIITAKAAGVVQITATAQDGSDVSGSAILTVTKKKKEDSGKTDPVTPNPVDPAPTDPITPGNPGKDDSGKEDSGKQDPNTDKPSTGNDQTPVNKTNTTGETDEVKATAIQVTADVKKAEDLLATGTMKLAPKKKMQLNVAFLPEDAEEEELTFTSSNPKIATVDEDGEIVAGKKAGKTTITVRSASGLTKTFRIQVMKKAVSKVKLQTKTKNLKVGKTLKIKAMTLPSKKYASSSILWISSNENIATVSPKGVVKGLKAGKVKITAVATDGSGKKATVTIKVK